MSTKTVYLFDSATFEYKAEYQAQESPLEPGVFIEPIHSFDVAPPTAGVNEIQIADPSAKTWSLQPDYRGQTIYDQSTGAPQEVTTIGAIPSGFSLTPLPPTLDQARTSGQAVIDAHAGSARTRYITTVPGQSETYAAKAADAAAYKAASYPVANLANYPWVQAEAQAINGAAPTASQAQAAADGILAAQTAWAAVGVKIEQQRRAASIAIQAAGTVADVDAAVTAGTAALDAI